MKALTLHQPYATAVALGIKTVETRSWPTSHRGTIAIHAGVQHLPRGVEFGHYRTARSGERGSAVVLHQFSPAGPLLGVPTLQAVHPLPLGAVVAVATVTDCVPMVTRDESYGRTEDGKWVVDTGPPDDRNLGSLRLIHQATDAKGVGSYVLDLEAQRPWGDYRPGRWAWLLADVQALAEPVPCRGYQRLWNLQPEAEALVMRQLAAWPT